MNTILRLAAKPVVAALVAVGIVKVVEYVDEPIFEDLEDYAIFSGFIAGGAILALIISGPMDRLLRR